MVIVCRKDHRRGLVRRLDLEIGFGPTSGPLPVRRLAGHSPGTAGFRRFRMSADYGRLPDCLFPRTDSEIGHRNRIRAEENTGIAVCPAARLVGDDQRTAVFRCFRLAVGGGGLRQGRLPWTEPGIGGQDWIWSDFGAAAGLAAGWPRSGDRRVPPFPDWCLLFPLVVEVVFVDWFGDRVSD